VHDFFWKIMFSLSHILHTHWTLLKAASDWYQHCKISFMAWHLHDN
jgi:hypothetical protein